MLSPSTLVECLHAFHVVCVRFLFVSVCSVRRTDPANNFNKINKNSFKPSVSEHVKDIVRQNFTREIEFYEFCRQRLHKQYLAVHTPLK